MIVVVIKTHKEAGVPAEELYILEKTAYKQWTEAGIYTPMKDATFEQFERSIKGKVIFVAQDAQTGELLAMHTLRLNKKQGSAHGADLSVSPKAQHEGIASRMLEAEAQRLRKNGYRYMVGSTAIPATWSVRWHLKNGYYIIGYSRSEKSNYASYVFRKQLLVDVRHHPMDLLWTRPLAPITAKLRYWATYIATCICKDKAGRLNWIGRKMYDVRCQMADGFATPHSDYGQRRSKM